MNSTTQRHPLEKQLNKLPSEVKFCNRCVVSNQRPRIEFDAEGICGACRHADDKRHNIDWQAREQELADLCDRNRREDGYWDVVVPGSGGKDSAYVAHVLREEYKMHPLVITWAPFEYTDIGYTNFSNFIGSGFTVISGHSNGAVTKKLARIAFEEVGDNFLPFIWGQFSFVTNMALKFGIKLVFYGELGELEYGGSTAHKGKSGLPIEEWVKTYWKGTTVDDLVSYGLTHKDYFSENDFEPFDLQFFRLPTLDQLVSGTEIHWMSHYRFWSPQENFYCATENTAFRANSVRSEGTYSKYTSLDDRLDSLHFFLMYIKLGIGRATADASQEIRDGHITREEGVELVEKYDGEMLSLYFKDTLDYLGIEEDEFWTTIDSFRLPHIWRKVNGTWKLRHTVGGSGADD